MTKPLFILSKNGAFIRASSWKNFLLEDKSDVIFRSFLKRRSRQIEAALALKARWRFEK